MTWFVDKLGPAPGRPAANPGQPVAGAKGAAKGAPPPKNAAQAKNAPPPKAAPPPEEKKKKKGWF